MRGTKHFIHKARQSQVGELDTSDKDRIRKLLREKFKLHALQGEVLYIHKGTGWLSQPRGMTKEAILRTYWIHCPDLLVKNHNPMIVIEIDGTVHWQNTKAVQKTNERNRHYEATDMRFVWLTVYDLQKDDKELEMVLRLKLAKKPSEGLR